MAEHIAEAQQVEQIKNFWKNYGKPIMAGVALGLVVMFGWRYWQQHVALENAQASAAYEHLLRSLETDDMQAVKKEAETIISDYAKTPYAQQAAMVLARIAVYEGDYDQASARLQWVINQSKIPALKQAARLRLARVQLAEKNYDDALKTLETVDDPAYKMAVYEIKGDVLAAKGDRKGAETSYRAALDELSKADFSYPLLQMKYDDLVGSDAIYQKEQTVKK